MIGSAESEYQCVTRPNGLPEASSSTRHPAATASQSITSPCSITSRAGPARGMRIDAGVQEKSCFLLEVIHARTRMQHELRYAMLLWGCGEGIKQPRRLALGPPGQSEVATEVSCVTGANVTSARLARSRPKNSPRIVGGRNGIELHAVRARLKFRANVCRTRRSSHLKPEGHGVHRLRRPNPVESRRTFRLSIRQRPCALEISIPKCA